MECRGDIKVFWLERQSKIDICNKEQRKVSEHKFYIFNNNLQLIMKH